MNNALAFTIGGILQLGLVGSPAAAKVLDLPAKDSAVAQMIETAAVAIRTEVPTEARPQALLELGKNISACSVQLAQSFVTEGFVMAVEMPGLDRRTKIESEENEIRTAKRVSYRTSMRWLASNAVQSKSPEMVRLAESLVQKIPFDKEGIDRQEVQLPLVSAMNTLGMREDSIAMVTRVERESGMFPFRLAAAALTDTPPDPEMLALINAGYRSIARGEMRKSADLEFVLNTVRYMERAVLVECVQKYARTLQLTQHPVDSCVVSEFARMAGQTAPEVVGLLNGYACPKAEATQADDMSKSADMTAAFYEDILHAAAIDASSLGQAALRVPDADLRKALLASALQRLRDSGDAIAADRVAVVLASLLPGDALQKDPAQMLLLARSTLDGQAQDALVRRALSLADKLLRESAEIYFKGTSSAARLAAYRSASVEPLAVYAMAARLLPQLAAERALQAPGPQRGEVLTAVLGVTCRKK